MAVYDEFKLKKELEAEERKRAIDAEQFIKSHYNDVWLRAALVIWPEIYNSRGPTSTLDQDIRWAFEGADEFLKQYKERVEGQTNDPA